MARIVFVTGGSRGIGRCLVDAFKRAGDQVATCATRTDHLESSAADLKLGCDVAEASGVRRAIGLVVKRFGHIDVVVNNAGIAGANPLDPGSDDQIWHRMIDVNLHGTYYMCKYALPHLPDQTGRIINIASTLGVRGSAEQTAYTAAKHGVVGLTKALALHTADRGITVNAICPTWVRSDMAINRWREMGATEADAAAPIPLGRIMEPEEIAPLAVYLASDAAGGITGQAMLVDGGLTA